MSNNFTTTAGDDTLLLLNQLELVTPTTVAGTFYGIAFTLFCLYVHELVPRFRDQDRKKQATFMLVYSTIIMLCGLYSLVANAWVTQDAYIKHGDYPGGPYGYILTTFHAPALAIGIACQMVILILTSAIQIWRVWVVWSATRYANVAIVLPTLCFLTFTALRLRGAILETTLPIDEAVQLDAKTDTPETALQAATTIICTALISVFLLVEEWRQSKLIGTSRGSVGYTKIVAVLIESYALESIWLLIEASLANANVAVAFFGESENYIEIIAYLLVQYRIVSGKACESQREQSRLSSLHWNRSHHVTTQVEATLEAGDDHHASKKLEASDELPVFNVRAE